MSNRLQFALNTHYKQRFHLFFVMYAEKFHATEESFIRYFKMKHNSEYEKVQS
jgi:hypothetical protein